MTPPDPFGLLCAVIDARLSGRHADPALAAAVADPRQPWPRIARLSGVHLLTPAFGAALEQLGLAGPLPADLRDYLGAMRTAGEERNRTLRADLLDILSILNAVGVEPVLLKGALRLVDDLFPDDAWRFMHDLDLLVPAADVDRAGRALRGLRWTEGLHDGEGGRHALVLMRRDGLSRLELHDEPLEAGWRRHLDAAGLLARVRRRERAGVAFLEPAPEDQIAHLVLHAQLQHAHLATGRFLLRDSAELALLARRHGAGILAAARERLVSSGAGAAVDHMLLLAAECLPLSAPEPPRGAGATARLLARRSLFLQRHPTLLAVAGPIGHLLASLGRRREGEPAGGSPGARLWRDLAVFRAKTSW